MRTKMQLKDGITVTVPKITKVAPTFEDVRKFLGLCLEYDNVESQLNDRESAWNNFGEISYQLDKDMDFVEDLVRKLERLGFVLYDLVFVELTVEGIIATFELQDPQSDISVWLKGRLGGK